MNRPTLRGIGSFLGFGLGFSLLGVTSAYLLNRLHWTTQIDPDALAYCEASSHGWLQQPANSLANIAFFWVGAAVFADWGQKRLPTKTPLSALTPQRVGFALACVCIGMGSLWFHATLAEWAGYADNFAMNLIATQMLVYSWERTFRFTPARSASVLAVLNVFLDAFVLTHNLGKILFGAVVAMSIVTEISIVFGRSVLSRLGETLGVRVRYFVRDARLLGATVAVFLPGALVWQHSRTGAPWCLPESWLQGHAFWHLTSAVAVLLNYLYFCSEQACPKLRDDAEAPVAEAESLAPFIAADAE